MQLDVFFASAVVVLAGLAVIGALVLVIVWEWRAICCTLQGHRPSRQEWMPADLVPVLPARRT